MSKKTLSFLIISFIGITIPTFFQLYAAPKRKSKILYMHEQSVRSLQDSKINSFIKQGNIVIVFYEDWCPPCNRMAPLIEEIAEKADDILFIKLKRSLYHHLFTQFGFSTIPALVFCKDGKVVHRRPKSANITKLVQLINKFFYPSDKKIVL